MKSVEEGGRAVGRHVRGLRRARRSALTLLAVMAATALIAGACTTDEGWVQGAYPDRSLERIPELDGESAVATFDVRPGVEQVFVTGATPGVQLALFDAEGVPVGHGTVDSQGSLIFRSVEPAAGYRVAEADDGDRSATEALEVIAVADSTPEQAFYDGQTLEDGFGYIETRDGTQLSVSVYLPGPVEDGPYPTVVEYSGYSPSKPGKNLIEDRWDELSKSLPAGLTLEQVCDAMPAACDAPDQPASLLAHAMGYAVVGVNMRGTGCSGGAYDFFEPLQVTDGYDAVEIVAAQDWVDGDVGMVGLSYPGISQLFVAQSQPPSLAAITPLSVYDDTARGVLAPGGVFNEGFALEWAEQVLTTAEPYGQGWEQDVVDAGDETCAQNQILRGQNVDAVAKAKNYPYYDPEIADPLNPSLFVGQIDVPVFLSGSFQDEQTGGRFPHLINRFDNAPVTKVNMWNGAHADGFSPQNLAEWKTFLDFYVGGELTERSAAVDLFLPLIMGEVFGTELTLPPQRMFTSQPTFEAKRAAYEAEDPITVTLESGAGDPERPGSPIGTARLASATWPFAGTTPSAWFLGPDGTLSQTAPTAETGASRFNVDPSLASLGTFADKEGNNEFRADATYDWRQEPDGSASVFVSAPLEKDLVLIGSASADLWVRSSYPEADLGVTLSEVRPDGKETYIQSGVLRGTQRKPLPESTEMLPLHSNLREDSAPLPVGEFAEARVEVFPFAQVIRAGSRIRLSVHTPGGDRVRWKYILADVPEDSTIDIGYNSSAPSKLVLSSVPGITGYPSTVPANCNSLRAQPCRDFVEYPNVDASDD